MLKQIRNKFLHNRGQSFVELALIILVLALLLAGVVEFGFLINNYLHVFDAGREAARFSANSVAMDEAGSTITEFYVRTAQQALRVMSPVHLVGNNQDDIVISVFSVAGSNITRHPSSTGWSLCANKGNPQLAGDVPATLWNSCTAHTSSLSNAEVASRLNSGAPPAGFLLVEIYYHYPQLLNLPILSNYFLNPVPVFTYTFMPLSSAEPTPTPRP